MGSILNDSVSLTPSLKSKPNRLQAHSELAAKPMEEIIYEMFCLPGSGGLRKETAYTGSTLLSCPTIPGLPHDVLSSYPSRVLKLLLRFPDAASLSPKLIEEFCVRHIRRLVPKRGGA